MTMESSQFDAAVGGREHLPYSANSLKFVASRSVEIAAMTENILRPSSTKLIFQSLPVHMRRRVMSHNCKRLPRKLRAGHMEQLKKSGLPPKQKRPSRKYRRRPANLLEEYNRRQKRNAWLETHIWHAKRFHMTERWGFRIANAPCDKAFRACYRASSAHCLLQDISYYTPVKITGPLEDIKDLFNNLTHSSCGLGICAKAFTKGNREGTIHLYNSKSFPYGYIGKITFIWTPNAGEQQILWLFVHPSHTKELEKVLVNVLETNTNNLLSNKKQKLNNFLKTIHIKFHPGLFNRFRLTGPKSHAVLANSLKTINNTDQINTDKWISLCCNELTNMNEKHEYWQQISFADSPSQLPARLILGLVVRDPRLSRPSKRSKAMPKSNQVNTESLYSFPTSISNSPIWDAKIHETIKENMLTNGQFIEHITKTQLVPGEVNLDDPALQSIPVVLIQRPGSQDPVYKKLGYGSGWDIIVPSGYGLPFWLTFIMFGGRSGGVRETESLAFEMGECYLPPDSQAGREEEKRIENEMKERYFRLPPSKRVNYIKIAVNSPFICPWKILLKDWSNKEIEDFFVLRDRQILTTLQECVMKKKQVPYLEEFNNCLVAVYIQIHGKGSLKRHAHICLPQEGDIHDIKSLFQPNCLDPNEKLRKEKKKQHIKDLKRWRRRRIKLKKNVVNKKADKLRSNGPSEYVKTLRELWLPTKIENVRHTASRQILGYLAQGAFSFSEALSCGVGYMTYNALGELLKFGHNQVLVRNTCSKKYRLADFQIVKNV